MSSQTDFPNLKPFHCVYTPNIPELLQQLNCSIVLSTYQAGKVILISATEHQGLIQLPRDFLKPMGVAVHKRRMAIATKNELVVLSNAQGLARSNSSDIPYDALWIPRAVYFTGELDLHDLAWGSNGLYAVNTRFSCLSIIDDHFSFRPIWKPHFIKDFLPTDQCHINGMAMKNGEPKIVSLLGVTNTEKGWRNNVRGGGVLMDVPSNQVIVDGLPMPHSPRIINDQIFVLLSATGEIGIVDEQSGKVNILCRVNGFVRGMAHVDNYLFIGLSKLRDNSTIGKELPIAQNNLNCGLVIFYIPTARKLGHIYYQSSVEEIYDVQLMNFRKPGILNHTTTTHRKILNTPITDFKT